MLDNIDLPSWHRRDTSLLDTAIQIARKNAPHLERLIFSLLPSMPRVVRASYDLKTRTPTSGMDTLAQAISAPWISFDSSTARNVFILDIDHADGLNLAMELPHQIRPHIVVDPWSGRSAGIVVLKTPVLIGPSAMKAPKTLAKVAYNLLKFHFRVNDDRPSGTLAKNPFGLASAVQGKLIRRTILPSTPFYWEAWEASLSTLQWHTSVGAFKVELNDIIKILATDDEQSQLVGLKKARNMPAPAGRNDEVFNQTRFWAYDNLCRDFILIQQRAYETNFGFTNPLSAREVDDIARSIHRYMQTFNPGRRSDLGVMKLSKTEFTISEKRRLSAVRTNNIRIESTDRTISEVINKWPAGVKLTQTAVANSAKVSLSSVKRRWSAIKIKK